MTTQAKKLNKESVADSENVTIIGREIKLVGRVEGEGRLIVQGRVEGQVEVRGQVIVEAGGILLADVQAQEMIIAGIVIGTVQAQACILQEKAKIVGDIMAIRLRMEPGASVRGNVSSGTENTDTQVEIAKSANERVANSVPTKVAKHQEKVIKTASKPQAVEKQAVHRPRLPARGKHKVART